MSNCKDEQIYVQTGGSYTLSRKNRCRILEDLTYSPQNFSAELCNQIWENIMMLFPFFPSSKHLSTEKSKV